MVGKVLLVEDDQAVRRAVTRWLRARGWRVVACSGVDAAVRALRQGDVDGQPFSLAVLDLEVGDRLGTEVAEHVEADTPVVFFTGATDPALLARALRYGPVVPKDRSQDLLNGLLQPAV